VGETDPAATFNGTSDAISVAGAADEAGVAPYTIEGWVRPSAINATPRYILARETSSGTRQGTGVWLSTAGLTFERWTNGVKTAVTVGAGLPLHAWSLVTATYDGATMRLFVNGKQLASRATTASLQAVTGPTELGAAAGGSSGFFAGDLDEVAVYPLALARAHVAAHDAAASTTPCATIAGATSPTYTPVAADLGYEISATVTSTNTHGTASVTANQGAPTDDGHGQIVAVGLGGVTPGATVSGTVQLTGLPSGALGDQIEFDVDGVFRYAKVDEPPYQYTWYTNAETNGTHTATVKLWGPGATTPVTASTTVTVSNKTVYATPLPFGEESMYAQFNEGDPATANNLLDNIWPARGYALPYLEWPLT
jgi:hypothetical protein